MSSIRIKIKFPRNDDSPNDSAMNSSKHIDSIVNYTQHKNKNVTIYYKYLYIFIN